MSNYDIAASRVFSVLHLFRLTFAQRATVISFSLIVPFVLYAVAGTGRNTSPQEYAASKTVTVGVARIDITPDGPIRLSGYSSRKIESEGLLQRLSAKALAFGTDKQGPSILITVDLIGIPGFMTSRLAARLSQKTGFDSANLTICTSHTHGGPEIGNLLNHFEGPLPADQLGRIIQYQQQLLDKLEKVALMSLEARRPALLSWGQGEVRFAKNRRVIKDGKWVGGGEVDGAPVDHAMPLLRVADPDGKLRAVFVSYACHGTTLGAFNQVHGDWIGEAQHQIELTHPGVTALVAVGCGADITPAPRYKMEHLLKYGKMIADEAERLLKTSLKPIQSLPTCRYRIIQLPFSHIPDVAELVQLASTDTAAKGYYARLSLEKIARGGVIAPALSYTIKTWTFANDLAMVFLAGEVVVDYSLRLKKELDRERLWINAYSNDVPSYIASRRVIQEGGYEAESSQYIYDRPSPYIEAIEDLIIATVVDMLPAAYKPKSRK
jgi:hypothetical protein